jgi:uncharacterized protein YbjT (DUF2867 family)
MPRGPGRTTESPRRAPGSRAKSSPTSRGSERSVDVVVIGGHGQVAQHLLRLLAARGDRARGVIRSPDQADAIRELGAEPVICDIESEDLTGAVARADAVVFAAGAGPGSGAERKRTVDYGGAVKLIDAAKANGISRYLMISAIGANKPETWSEEMTPYYEAKADADAALEASGLDYTIVRPGGLTDDPATGRIAAAPHLERGRIPREDVAATLLAVLDLPSTAGMAFDLVGGDTPIPDAVKKLTA